MAPRVSLVGSCVVLGLSGAPLSVGCSQSIKPIFDALGLAPTHLEAVLKPDAWSSLAPDEWGNPRYQGVVLGQRLELTAYVADGQLLQVELSGHDLDGAGPLGSVRDSLVALYGPHTGVYSPLTWTVSRGNNPSDTIEIREGVIRAFVTGATTRLLVAKLMRSGLDWSCVERRIGGLSDLPQNQRVYYDSVLTITRALRAVGADFEMLRRASCGRIQVGDLRDAVTLAYGTPEWATGSRDASGLREIWYYDAKRTAVTLVNGAVIDIARRP